MDLFTSFAFLLGALLGSFGNVVIHRLPLGESVVSPRSKCPKCNKQISWYDNIPIISWIVLRGKCRGCGTRISIRYPIVEALTAILFASTYYKFGLSMQSAELMILQFGLVIVAFIDLDHMIIPDELSLSGIVLGFGLSFLNSERAWLDSLIGILIGGGFLWSIASIYYLLTKREGLGGGDIKLLAWIGAFLGWQSIPFTILSSSVLGSLVGIAVSLKSKEGLKAMIPFGPFIVLGAILYIHFDSLASILYWDFFLPGLRNQ